MWQYYLFQAVSLWVGQACLFILTSFCWPHPSAVCTASVWSLVHTVLQAYEGKSERLCHGPGQALRKGKAWKATCRPRSALVFRHFHLPRAKPITNCALASISVGEAEGARTLGSKGASHQQLQPGRLSASSLGLGCCVCFDGWMGWTGVYPRIWIKILRHTIFCYSTEESGLELGRYPPWLLQMTCMLLSSHCRGSWRQREEAWKGCSVVIRGLMQAWNLPEASHLSSSSAYLW